ncbi:HTTM domain-containing protein [Mycobacterium aquaticum]|uniref:HTTM domain-containing protein n=1 Tax=Mycobacterium aquaticum TaxID=1927124 RepID=UPI0013019CB5|nr:HTTM domain-containing protein [Mycobacterium aquaticum]
MTARPFSRLWSSWQRFWFEPQETSSLALFRIAFGLLATAWTATLIPDLFAFYGPRGILPDNTAHGLGQWGLLALSNNPVLLLGVFAATLFSALALTVGLFTRVAAIVVWLGIVSLQHRNLLVGNAGDLVVRDLAFFCALAPAGAALSIDRIRKAPGQFWQFPLRAPWALRLIQIQISVGYLSAVWHKAQNELWTQGTAVSYALRLDDVHRLPTPDFVTHSVIVTNMLTFGTMLVELALAVLIWNRKARPWVLVAGVSLHLGIDSSILVGFFSYAMLASYLCFVPPESATRFILMCRDVVIRWAARAAGSIPRTSWSPGAPDVSRV